MEKRIIVSKCLGGYHVAMDDPANRDGTFTYGTRLDRAFRVVDYAYGDSHARNEARAYARALSRYTGVPAVEHVEGRGIATPVED